MRKIFYWNSMACLVMLLMICATLVSCGSDDENSSATTLVGIHRVEIEFDGVPQSDEYFFINTSVYGLKVDGSFSKLYENGSELELVEPYSVWQTSDVRRICVQTEDNSAMIAANVCIGSVYGGGIKNDMTVTMRGYVNNRQMAMRVFTLHKGDTYIDMNFVTDVEGGTIDGYTNSGEIH